jgi:predicted RNA methylase
VAETVFLTTQPGWAFATLAELRARGVTAHVDFWHRDSTLVVPASEVLSRRRLHTPADAHGTALAAKAKGAWDATAVLARSLRQGELQPLLWRWLVETKRTRMHRYSIGSEVWGDTAVRRRDLAAVVRGAMRVAFPRWREEAAGGLRLFCKADTRAALVGVQLYSNLETEPAMPGALREHLACGLLAVAGARRGDPVLDPFMGTGTILRAATRHYGAAELIGVEVDRASFRWASERLPAEGTRLLNASFEALDPATLPGGLRLVTNLPFGVRFGQAPTERLVAFLRAAGEKLAGAALLLSREQAAELAAALPLRQKNVLVLGQPAAIACW